MVTTTTIALALVGKIAVMITIVDALMHLIVLVYHILIMMPAMGIIII
jgi:hypothetical protein